MLSATLQTENCGRGPPEPVLTGPSPMQRPGILMQLHLEAPCSGFWTGIFAGLIMVEAKCCEVDTRQHHAALELSDGQ